MGIRTVGIFFTDTPWGFEHSRDFKLAFEKLGGEIVGEEKINLLATDVRTEMTKLDAKNPDAVLNIGTSGPNLGLPMKQAKEIGMDVKWLASFAGENAPLVKEYGELVDGLVYPYPYDENSDVQSVKEFIKAYKAKYGEVPDNTAANAYDALKVLASAIEEAGEDTLKVKHTLLSIKNFPGGSGSLSFDANGDVKQEILIKQIQDGEFVRIQ
jgi:branched-chain amino acid transport system substrate-binding protein